MRGKNIVWLSLIAVLAGAFMASLGGAATPAKLYIDPDKYPNPPALGHAGDVFTIDINVDNVVDLYAYGFTLEFAKYGSVLIVSKITEGPFLKQGGTTIFKSKVNTFAGTVKIGCTLLGAIPGVSGSGTLVSITFIVNDAGDSALDLVDTGMVNSNLGSINHNVWSSYYYGATADLIRSTILPGRHGTVGDTMVFESKVRNDGDVPLHVRVRFDITRMEDLKCLTLYAGQRYLKGWKGEPPIDYLYANEYNEFLEWDWINPGGNAIGEPDGAYVEGQTYCGITSLYGFEDIPPLGPNDVIGAVYFEAYTQYPWGADEDNDLDIYDSSFNWYGSEYGSDAWGWHTPRWIGAPMTDVNPDLYTAEGVNNFEALIHYWTADGENHGPARIDAMRLRIEYAAVDPVIPPEYVIYPGEELVLDPVTWILTEDAIGTYTMTTTLEYTYNYWAWHEGAKSLTRTWWCTD